ncbi:MAG TPA: hypothetical protein VGA70_13995 [Longimicrobiales bacterium]|jgi:hypothetical protein
MHSEGKLHNTEGMQAEEIKAALQAVGELLAADDEHTAIVIVGGATLNLLGVVRRPQDITWRNYGGGLDVGLVGRRTLINLKLFAAVDRGPRSVHLQDLVALNPTEEELEGAAAWVFIQDAAPEWPSLVNEVIEHVERSRQ